MWTRSLANERHVGHLVGRKRPVRLHIKDADLLTERCAFPVGVVQGQLTGTGVMILCKQCIRRGLGFVGAKSHCVRLPGVIADQCERTDGNQHVELHDKSPAPVVRAARPGPMAIRDKPWISLITLSPAWQITRLTPSPGESG